LARASHSPAPNRPRRPSPCLDRDLRLATRRPDNRLAGCDPAVAFPVDADEDLALLEVDP
jgi:hypothetical protein